MARKRTAYQPPTGVNPANRKSVDSIMKRLSNADCAPLSREVERIKVREMLAGNLASREAIIKSNLRMCLSVASRYYNSAYTIEDALQNAVLGLIKGVDKTNPAFDNRVLSYAIWDIKNTVMAGLHTAAQVHQVAADLNFIQKISKISVENLTTEQSARLLDIERVKSLKSTSDAVHEDGGILVIDTLDVPFFESPDTFEILDKDAILNRLLCDLLSPLQREIVVSNFGLLGVTQCEIQDIAKNLGMKVYRVSDELGDALDILRENKKFFELLR